MDFEKEKSIVTHDVKHEENVAERDGLGADESLSSRVLWLNLWTISAAFSYGFSCQIISACIAQPNYLSYFATEFAHEETGKTGAIVGIYNVGGAIASVLISYISDKWGRKSGIYFSTFFCLLGAALATGSQNVVMLVMGRLFSGAGSWAVLFSAIIYQGECASATRRGLLSGTVGPAVTSGYVIAAWLGVAFTSWNSSSESSWTWRTPFLLQIVPTIIVAVFLPFIPESPRWLAFVGRNTESLAVLKLLHHSPKDPQFAVAREEHYEIVSQVALDRSFPNGWVYMFRHHWKESGLAVLVCTTNQVTGLALITNYGPTIYGTLGFSPLMAVILAAAWVTIGVFFGFACAGVMDRFGRRPILIWSALGCAGAMACIVGLIGEYLDSTNVAGQRACVAFFFLFVVPYEFNEPVMFVYIAEILPSQLRAKGIALGLVAINIPAIWITESQPTGVAKIGYKYYLLFPVLTVVLAGMLYLWVVETKGVPLEEVGLLFGHEEEVKVRSANLHIDEAGNVVDLNMIVERADSIETAA